MSEGLLGDAVAEVAADSKSAEKRRVKLFPWDSVATQLLEPYGESSFETLSLEKLYAATAKGNKGAAYHSHLCAPMDTDPWHVGAGISLTAAALLAAIDKFRSEEMQALLKPELYAKVREELVELEPVLKRLNLGRGSQVTRDAGSFREAKKQKTGHATSEPVVSTPDEMKQAAFAFHKWLKQPRSAFRSLLFILAGGNTYYTGHVAETTARAVIEHKPLTQVDFQTAMVERMSKAPQASTTASSTSGLFDL